MCTICEYVSWDDGMAACYACHFSLTTIAPACTYQEWAYDLNGVIQKACIVQDLGTNGETICATTFPDCGVIIGGDGTPIIELEDMILNSCP